MTYEAKTCTLQSGAVVTFNVTDTTADDVTETVTWYDIFTRSVGK